MIRPSDILRATVLMVDDQEANLASLKRILGDAGYCNLTTTSDPHAVCALHAAHRYDVILLDLQMPDLDGYAVMAGLQEIEQGGYLPVIVTTGHTDHKLPALRAGARDFITKPFDRDEVLLRVHNVLEVRLLHRSEALLTNARLNNAQRLASLGDWEYQASPPRVLWSDELYRIVGLDRAENPPTPETFHRLVHPEDVAAFHRVQREALARDRRAEFEFRIIRPDGEVRHLHQVSESEHDATGRLVRESGTVQDVTARHHADQALRTSEKRFKAFFEQAAVGVAQADACTGRIVHANQRYCEIVGYQSSELLDSAAIPVTHPQDLDRHQQLWHQLVAGAIREYTHEKRYLRKDGTEFWVILTVSAMWTPGEKPDHCIAVVQDITGRKQLEAQFLQTQKMELLGQFSGGVAHDFNNILAVITGYNQLARMILKDNPDVRRHLDAVAQGANRATQLVRQILTFSRQHPQQRRHLRLQPIITESLTLLRATIPATIELESTASPDAPEILADTNQIHQILMNLGTNAVYAMKDGTGRLTFTLERCVVAEEQASPSPRLRPGVYARLAVIDTGCGMDPATLRRIFEPFFTTKPAGQGTGLGLSVVRGIMDRHEGEILAFSRPGHGTTFHLYFPAHVGAIVMQDTKEGPVPRGNGERILVIDDEELIAEATQQALKILGYEAEIATVPAIAVGWVRSEPGLFDLVITDQTMPRMTGLALAGEIHAIRPDLPVILTTGYSATLTNQNVAAAGIHKLLLKPVGIHALGTAVRSGLLLAAPA